MSTSKYYIKKYKYLVLNKQDKTGTKSQKTEQNTSNYKMIFMISSGTAEKHFHLQIQNNTTIMPILLLYIHPSIFIYADKNKKIEILKRSIQTFELHYLQSQTN